MILPNFSINCSKYLELVVVLLWLWAKAKRGLKKINKAKIILVIFCFIALIIIFIGSLANARDDKEGGDEISHYVRNDKGGSK